MRSENLQLRALEPEDIDLLFEWENNTSVWHLSGTLAPFSRFALEQYVLNAGDDIFTSKQLRLMIDLAATSPSETIGCIDLFDFDPQNLRAGVGIMIADAHRGKGYASEALDMVMDYAFGRLQLHQLYANVLIDNEASITLFKRKHFTEIGVKKEWIRNKDSWIDEIMLQRLK